MNLWFCLWLLGQTEATAFRVHPVVLSEEDRWLGFGKLDSADLKLCFDARIELTREDISLGAALWNAFRSGDNAKLTELSKTSSLAFPYLSEVVQAAVVRDSRPAEILAELGAGLRHRF